MRKIEIEILNGKAIIKEDLYNLPDLAEIRTLRKALKLTQKELGEIIGSPQSIVSNWETEKRDPPYSKVKKIFESLQALYERSELNNPKIKVTIPFLGVFSEQ